MRRKQGEKDASGGVITNRVTVKTVKNKLAPPFKKCEFDIIFGEGIDRIGEIVEWGTEIDLIKKSGSWYSYGDTKLGQGTSGIRTLLKDNPELTDELEAKIRTFYQI